MSEARAFVPIPNLLPVEVARFFAKVVLSEGCHAWTGSRDKYGRGRLNLRRYPVLAPRVAYKLHTGHDPAERRVLHDCDNPNCVNPAHLKLGSQADNIAECVSKGRAARGERNGSNRAAGIFTEAVVREVKALLAAGERVSVLARRLGVGDNQISNIKHGRKWGWVT